MTTLLPSYNGPKNIHKIPASGIFGKTDGLDKEKGGKSNCNGNSLSNSEIIKKLGNDETYQTTLNIIGLLETLKKQGYGDFNRLIADTINPNILNNHHLIRPRHTTEHPLIDYLKLIET